jgi:phosphohistidine phosphatase SixA
VYMDELYHAEASKIFEIISGYPASRCIMVVGHNDGISRLAERLSMTGAEPMATCGIYIFEFSDTIEWNKGIILDYLSPRNI